MKSKLDTVYDPEIFRSAGHDLVDHLADYLEQVRNTRSWPVLPEKDPETLYQKYRTLLKSGSHLQIQEFFKSVIKDSIHIHHPGYVGHQVCAPAPLGALAGLIADLLNNGSAIFDMGPANTAMEKILIDLTCRRIGYSEKSDGILTSGGSIGNLTALLAARKIKCSSLSVNPRPVFLVSDQSHYSITKSLKIIGLSMLPVSTDTGFRMRTDLLDHVLSTAKESGHRVIGVVANACSTATGSYDNLLRIADFTQKHDLWFHVDGAHGGAAVFSKRYRSLLEGIEQADSVVIDFHKMMMTPALVTAVLFKNSENSYQTFAEKASYLWEGEEREWFNLSKRTLECTKRSLGLKVFTLLHAFGEEIFEENLEKLYDLARCFAERISQRKYFQLAIKPESNIVCFRYTPSGFEGEITDSLNEDIRNRIVGEGRFYLVQVDLRGHLYLRTALMNPFTTIEDLDTLLNKIESIGAEISKGKNLKHNR